MVRSFRQSILCGAAVAAFSASSALAGPHTFFDDIQGVDLSAEGGYLMGSGDLPYAQFSDGVKDYAFKVSPGDGWSGAFTANARFDDGTNVRATWNHMSSNESAATASYNQTNSNSGYPIWNILGYLDNRPPNGATSYNSATVSTDVRADVVDLQIGHDVGLGMDGEFMLLGGLRIADYQQSTSMDLYCSRPTGTSGSGCSPSTLIVATHRSSRFTGVGPQLGGTYSEAIGWPGFGVFGSALVSAILGKQTTNNESTFVSTASQSGFDNNHIAYTFDGRAGLSYTMSNCPVVLALGYQVSFLDGVRDSQNEASASGTTTFGSHEANLLYHGPFLRLTYTPF